MAPEGRVVDGIHAEEAMTGLLREEADLVIDTSELPLAELRRRIEQRFRPQFFPSTPLVIGAAERRASGDLVHVELTPGAAVTINVTGSADELRVEVTDTGGSPSTVTSGSGLGLTGLRDRLAAYGGTLTADRRPTGGFRVVAVTPLP